MPKASQIDETTLISPQKAKEEFPPVDKDTMKNWYRLLHLGRQLDLQAASYLKKGMGWSYHAPYQGHDAIQLALGLSFRAGKDFLFPYYRDMLTTLAGGLTIEEILLNGLSRDTDVAGGGRHMSNHFAKPSIRIQNVSSLTGNHSLHAVGVARAIRKYDGDEIAFYSSGESACSEGYFYEAVNGASREKLPVIFVIQNNRYGISVPVHEQSANTVIAKNFSGFLNLKIVYCDGTDVFDSWRAMQEAIEYVKSGKGAAMVHADCERIGSHSNSDNQMLYRSPEEIEAARQRDPFPKYRTYLLEKEIFSENELQEIEAQNFAEIAEATPKAEKAPLPSPKSVHDFVLPEFKPTDGEVHDLSEPDGDPGLYTDETLKFLQAITLTQIEEFEHNENTFLWGQDVASRDKGGVFNAEKGMLQKFGPRRIFNAPIAEDFIVGTANGFCRYRDDVWVLIEGAEFADYIWPAMEQVVETSHEYWRTKGQYVPNMLMRVASGGYINGGLYHSQNVEGSFTTFPGLRIIVPAFADDMQGLIRSAMRSRGVTVFLEPKFLYNHPWAKTKALKKDILIPFGKARFRRHGTDLSIITYGSGVHMSMRAAERLEKDHRISVEVLDLRSLAPLDKDAIFATVKKTGKALVVHEDKRTGGFGGEIASLISEYCFESLDAPVMRLGSLDTPVGFAKVLEQAILLSDQNVYDKALELARY
ncbi:MAG: 2-oxoisovalerate dehydrogenase [Chlorobiales bacterium]|nr:2-oxoisovalerate dehydrogenase [Chlorobiales bacterium]